MLMPDCGIMPRMDIRILRYFIAVAEEGNITKAAARLHVSQPALSTQLAALEDELGQRLFERGARGIELTEKGLVLKRRADDLVDFAERIESEMKANGGEELEGTVSIGAGETPAFRFVARAAAQLARDNPRLRFSISSGNGDEVSEYSYVHTRHYTTIRHKHQLWIRIKNMYLLFLTRWATISAFSFSTQQDNLKGEAR